MSKTATYFQIKNTWATLVAHKWDNLDEVDQFLERHNVPNLTQEETDDINRSRSIQEIE